MNLPPRVTHYILIHSWGVYVVSAESAGIKNHSETNWIPVIAESNADASEQGCALYLRLTGNRVGTSKGLISPSRFS